MSSSVPSTFPDYFDTVFNEAFKILIERQEGYGPGNIEALGPHGVFSRLASDKCARVANSLNGKLLNGKIVLDDGWFDDGVRDALIDIANYAFILIAIGEGKWSGVSRGEKA